MDVRALPDRLLTVAELFSLGFTRMQLSRLVQAGELERPWRGVYRRPGEADQRAAWAALTVAHPDAVFWLYSAAVFHGLTENLGVALYVGVPLTGKLSDDEGRRHVSRWASEKALTLGVEEHEIDGVSVKITSPERTVVDFFRMSSMGGGSWRKNSVEPDVLFDIVSRYVAKHGAGLKLRRMANAFKVWDAMKVYLNTIQLARPDLFSKAA